jgi:hypothetical protein
MRAVVAGLTNGGSLPRVFDRRSRSPDLPSTQPVWSHVTLPHRLLVPKAGLQRRASGAPKAAVFEEDSLAKRGR